MTKNALDALDDLKDDLAGLYDDFDEVIINQRKFKEKVIELATEWADLAIRM